MEQIEVQRNAKSAQCSAPHHTRHTPQRTTPHCSAPHHTIPHRTPHHATPHPTPPPHQARSDPDQTRLNDPHPTPIPSANPTQPKLYHPLPPCLILTCPRPLTFLKPHLTSFCTTCQQRWGTGSVPSSSTSSQCRSQTAEGPQLARATQHAIHICAQAHAHD